MKKSFFKTSWQIIKGTFKEFGSDNVMKFSASLAYYTIFSIAPMLILIIYLVGFIWGQDAIEGEIYSQLNELLGKRSALQVQEIIKNISVSNQSVWATTLGIVTLFVGATGIFTEIQDSLNLIWGIKAKPDKGWLKFLINRLLSFAMIVSMGFLLLVSLVVSALLAAFSKELQSFFPSLTVYIFQILNFAVGFLIIMLLFAAIFKILPDAKISWEDVWIGAGITTLLFIIGKFAIGFYISKSNIASTYGAAASLVVLLVWIYYSSVILYLGAEFTQVRANYLGHKIVPANHAVLIKKVEVEEQVSQQQAF